MVEARINIPQGQIAAFCRRYQVRRLAVFGSVLRQDYRPESDVDVLVEFDPDAQVGFLTLSRMQRELSMLMGRPVDLVPREGLKPKIREAILSSAEELYAT